MSNTGSDFLVLKTVTGRRGAQTERTHCLRLSSVFYVGQVDPGKNPADGTDGWFFSVGIAEDSMLLAWSDESLAVAARHSLLAALGVRSAMN